MAVAMDMEAYARGPSGTGTRVGRAAVIVAGVAGLVATFTTLVSIWLQSYDCLSLYLAFHLHYSLIFGQQKLSKASPPTIRDSYPVDVHAR